VVGTTSVRLIRSKTPINQPLFYPAGKTESFGLRRQVKGLSKIVNKFVNFWGTKRVPHDI
jgi:hypothetical protein